MGTEDQGCNAKTPGVSWGLLGLSRSGGAGAPVELAEGSGPRVNTLPLVGARESQWDNATYDLHIVLCHLTCLHERFFVFVFF